MEGNIVKIKKETIRIGVLVILAIIASAITGYCIYNNVDPELLINFFNNVQLRPI